MKRKEINKNMHVNYKLLFFVPLFMTMGCKNVYETVATHVYEDKVLVRDINSGDEKIFVGDSEYNKYIRSGDTIDFYIQKSIDKNGEYYNNTKVFYTRSSKIQPDTLYARQEREHFNSIKREMMSQQKTK